MRSTVMSDRWANEVLEDGRRYLLVKRQEINLKTTPVQRVTARDWLVKDRPGGDAQHHRK